MPAHVPKMNSVLVVPSSSSSSCLAFSKPTRLKRSLGKRPYKNPPCMNVCRRRWAGRCACGAEPRASCHRRQSKQRFSPWFRTSCLVCATWVVSRVFFDGASCLSVERLASTMMLRLDTLCFFCLFFPIHVLAVGADERFLLVVRMVSGSVMLEPRRHWHRRRSAHRIRF